MCASPAASKTACSLCRYFAHIKQLAAAANALMLQKCLQKRMWPQSDRLLSQMPKVGRQLANKLHAAGIDSLAALNAADPRRVESLAQRAYPFGARVSYQHQRAAILFVNLKDALALVDSRCSSSMLNP